MKPIAKAMAAACCTAVCITAANAAPAGSASRNRESPRIVARTEGGFVIRASVPEEGGGRPTFPTHPELIRIGAGVHLDARLLLPPASPIEEISHARR